MSNYIPSSFNGLYIQNLKNVPERTEYDYEIGGNLGTNKWPKVINWITQWGFQAKSTELAI